MNTPNPMSALRCACAVLALAASAAQAQTSRTALESLPLAQLAQQYVQCERAAAESMLDGSAAMQCSLVYEAFKQRAFGGSHERLRAWWRKRGAEIARAQATPHAAVAEQAQSF